jgi:UDP-N-acetylglucosamine transferase subunit ALG13
MSAGRVYLAASGGGHLDLLRRAAPQLEGLERTWVTTAGRAAEELRASGDRVLTVPPFDRSNRGVGNLTASLALVRQERPRLVVTSGAGVVVAFCAASRLLGARIMFAETMARVTNSSLSGRVLSRLAQKAVVQWPEMAAVHRGAIVCRPQLLEGLPSATTPRGQGAFVALGTHTQKFDRLLQLVDRAVVDGVIQGDVVVQSGASDGFPFRGEGVRQEAWFPPAELREAIARSQLVICHAGSGICATALHAGRRPLILPRLGEHVDDHQVQLADKLAELGLAVRLGDGPITRSHVTSALAPITAPVWPAMTPSVGEVMASFAGERSAQPAI